MNQVTEGTLLTVPERFSRAEDRELPAMVPPADATPMSMLAVAVQKGMDPDTIARLLALQKEWEANLGRKAFDEAMAAAKAEIPVIHKNREVDFTSAKGRTNYRYEDLGEIAKTIDPILAKHGLSYRFRTSSTPNEPIVVTCIVAHSKGHSEENTLCAARDESGNKNSIQAIGSTLTYLQRMTLKAALGLAASTDDDGRGAGKNEIEPDPEGKKSLEACGSLAALQDVWKALKPEQRRTLGPIKDGCKQRIQEAEKAAQQ